MALPRLVSTMRASSAVSPERTALAAAIDAWNLNAAEIKATEAAVSKADDAWHEARRAQTKAAAAIETAKTEAAAHLVSTALGTAGTAPTTIRQARGLLLEADDNVDATKAALDALQASRESASSSASFLRIRLEDTAYAVVRAAPEVAALVAEVSDLQQQLASKGAALIWLDRNRAIDKTRIPGALFGSSETSPAETALNRLGSPLTSWSELLKDAGRPGGEQHWKQAVAALMTDATAQLPS